MTTIFPPRVVRGAVRLLLASAPLLLAACWGGAAEGRTPSNSAVRLADLEPLSARQGWGALQFDRSVTGKPLRIGERTFAHGLGTHAPSELVYDLGQRFDRFSAWIGIDQAMAEFPRASVTFKVLGDGRELFASNIMRPDSPPLCVDVPVRGVTELRLLATDAGDGMDGDHADWAEALLTPQALPSRFETERPRFVVRCRTATLGLTAQGRLAGISLGNGHVERAVTGGTHLPGCTETGATEMRLLPGGAIQCRRSLVHRASGQGCQLTERFVPERDNIRWELELEGNDGPWSAPIETEFRWPTPARARFWTAWDDPERQHGPWHDPLTTVPFPSARFCYGSSPWDEDHPRIGWTPGNSARFSIPLATALEEDSDSALTLALSPEDVLLDVTLTVTQDGTVRFTRRDHRIQGHYPVRLTAHLAAHRADWRGGLGWIARRYAPFFEPPNPQVAEIAGLGAYSDWEGELDAPRLRQMGFKVNWKASYDFPYMGMFLPPIPDGDRYPRFAKTDTTSIAQLAAYSSRMRALGFHVLNYFNVTEFGGATRMPTAPDPALPPAERWRNVHNFMNLEIPDGILRDLDGRPYPSWEGCVAMDCGDPRYRAFLLEQVRRHLARLPDSSGFCIDRLDWLRMYNFRADDGVSWRHGQACRALYSSWRAFMEEMGPLVHGAGKAILANTMIDRTELCRHLDGIYHEFGHLGPELNGAALQCVFKPCLAWTPDTSTVLPDPDAYFQRHLYLGVYPTAPLPANDHTILPHAEVDRHYLRYGPLFGRLRGKRWVLEPHAVRVVRGPAKANLFEVENGWLLAVVLGGQAGDATVEIRCPPLSSRRPSALRAQAFHPGASEAVEVRLERHHSALVVEAPLRQGCAMVRIAR